MVPFLHTPPSPRYLPFPFLSLSTPLLLLPLTLAPFPPLCAFLFPLYLYPSPVLLPLIFSICQSLSPLTSTNPHATCLSPCLALPPWSFPIIFPLSCPSIFSIAFPLPLTLSFLPQFASPHSLLLPLSPSRLGWGVQL